MILGDLVGLRFFHFVLWSSGGQDLVADLQGVRDEQDFLLVDPVRRPGTASIGPVCLETVAPRCW